MNRTALFRLIRNGRPRTGRPGIDLFLPKRCKDEDRLEICVLGILTGGGYSLFCFAVLKAFVSWPLAALLTLAALFVLLQLLTYLSASLQCIARWLGLRETPPDGEFSATLHLSFLTFLAVCSLRTELAPLGWIWLAAVGVNLFAAIWLFVRPPWRIGS